MDGMSFFEQINATRKEIIPLIENHSKCWRDELIPALAKEEIHIKDFKDFSEKNREKLREFLKSSIIPSIKIPKVGFESVSIENLHINLYISGFQNQPKLLHLAGYTDRKIRSIDKSSKKRIQ